MRWTDLATAIVASVWAFLLVAGIDGLSGIRAQHVAGYPAYGQFILYGVIPALFLTIIASAIFLSRRVLWFYDVYPFTVVAAAFCLFPVLMVWGGGI